MRGSFGIFLWAWPVVLALVAPFGRAQTASINDQLILSDNAAVVVCPETWQQLVILRPPVEPSFFQNISDWGRSQYSDWIKDDLSKEYIPSAVFLGIAIASALIFFLWRIIVCSCHPCCCWFHKKTPAPKDMDTEAADAPLSPNMSRTPHVYATAPDLLPPLRSDGTEALPSVAMTLEPAPMCGGPSWWSNWWNANNTGNTGNTGWCMLWLKVAITLLAGGAIGVTIWGMVTANKGIAQQGWDQLNNTVATVTQVTYNVDSLLMTAAGFIPIIGQLQAMLVQVVRLPELANITQSMATALASPALGPTGMVSSVVTAAQSLQTLRSSLLTLDSSLPNTLTALQDLYPAMVTVAGSPGNTTLLRSRLLDLQSVLADTPVTESAPAARNLSAAIAALDLPGSQAYVTSLSNALRDYGTAGTYATGNLTATIAALQDVGRAVNSTALSMGVFASNLTQLLASNDTNLVDLGVNYLDGIQTEVIQLPNPLDTIYQSLQKLQSLLNNSLTVPALALDAANSVTNFTSQLQPPPAYQGLVAALGQVNTALQGLPSASTYMDWVDALQVSLTALDTPLSTTEDAVAAYLATTPGTGPSGTAYAALAASLPPSVTGTDAAGAASGLTPVQAANQAAVAGAAGAVVAVVSANTQYRDQAQQVALSVRNSLSLLDSKVPGDQVAQLVDVAEGVRSALASLPTTGNQTVEAVLTRLSATLSVLNTAVEVTATQLSNNLNNSLNGYFAKTADVRNTLADQEQTLRNKYYVVTITIDKWRYIATMIVYALGVLFLVLTILAVCANVPAALTSCLVAVNILLVLFFAVAFAISVLLAGGNDACPGMETIVKSFLGEQWTPMANYYFFNYGGNLTQVLAQEGIVDLNQINTTVETAQSQLSSGLLSQVTPVGLFKSILTNTNTTIDATQASTGVVVTSASYSVFNPVYVQAKSFLCCTIPEEVKLVWIATTTAGWVMLALTWCGNALITQFYNVTSARSRCGWKGQSPYGPDARADAAAGRWCGPCGRRRPPAGPRATASSLGGTPPGSNGGAVWDAKLGMGLDGKGSLRSTGGGASSVISDVDPRATSSVVAEATTTLGGGGGAGNGGSGLPGRPGSYSRMA